MDKLSVISYAYVDYRFTVDIGITGNASELLNPFFNGCFLVPKSRASDYLQDADSYKDYEYVKVPQAKYASLVKGELLKGATTFYNQPHTDANMGVLVFPDTITTTTLGDDGVAQNTTTTQFENLTEEEQLSIMNNCVTAIGRNAIYVGVAEVDVKRYNKMIDTFRLCDSNLMYVKGKVRNALIDTDDNITTIKDDFQAYGATLLLLQKFEAQSETTNVEYGFENRLDFIAPSILLNSYTPSTSSNSYVVGYALDGKVVSIPASVLEYSNVTKTLDKLTMSYITYLQVRADDKEEIVIAGGGIYYQGLTLPVNMFLFAKYAQYVLKSNLFYVMTNKNKEGVANADYYNQAIDATMTQLEPYSELLLDTITSSTYTQKEINDSISDKTITLANCIVATTKPTPLFAKATIGVSIA